MAKPTPAKQYSQNVFINCPFDKEYSSLFDAIVFAVHDMGFRPRCALEARNAGQFRLEKILEIISQCKYSIHDLSRTELDPENRLPRFNMPFELGLDLGCKKFGSAAHREKVCLILDAKPLRIVLEEVLYSVSYKLLDKARIRSRQFPRQPTTTVELIS